LFNHHSIEHFAEWQAFHLHTKDSSIKQYTQKHNKGENDLKLKKESHMK
jgi:hypothetical protein